MGKLKVLTGRIADPYILPTGSVGLNRVLNGGIMGGRIHVYWGPKASGKTTQALFSIAEAQRMGKVCMYVDAEKTYCSQWAEKCGVDVDELRLVRANAAEDILTTIIPMIEKEEIDVVVIDSLSSIFVSSFLDKPEGGGIGISARSANFLVSKILSALALETQVILIAHGNMAAAGQGFSLQAKISKSVEHWASTIVKFRLGMGKDDYREADGAKQVYWKVEKSKHSVYPVEGKYWISTKTPVVFIDRAMEVAQACKDEGIVQGSTWLSYEGEKWQGINQFASALKSDHDLFKMFEAKLNELEVVPLEEEEGEE